MKIMTFFHFALFLILIAGVFNCSKEYDKEYDIVIKNGQIYDGSGEKPFYADVGIRDGIIYTIGKLEDNTDVVIDANGMIVAPGFIDIHNHCAFSDREIKKFGLTEEVRIDIKNYLFQGVTTVVTGNCGIGEYEIGQTLKEIRDRGVGLNVIYLVAHGSIREAVMGKADREPSPAEMDAMKKLVRKAMEEGAVGLSTGLYYVPGSYAKTEEIIELAKVVYEFDGIYATHIRDEGGNNMGGLLAAIREAIKIGEEAKVPVQIAHIKAYTKSNWGKSKDVCAIIEEARARGVKVFADQYPYPASSTSLSAITLPRWVKAGDKMEENINNPDLKDKLILGIKERMDLGVVPDMLKIATFEEKKEWEGKTLEDISVLMKLPPIETIIKVLQIGDPDLINFGMSPDDVEYFMKKPYIMTSSDGGNLSLGVGLPHPRNYGAFPRKIRHYVLEKEIITMEHAIRAATSLPAEMVGLKERGLIKEGFIADVVVFNPETIKDKATFINPHQYSEGIEYLLVNGILTIKDGKYTGTLAGKPLRINKN